MEWRDERNVFAAFLIGGMLGAGFALLFAPQSGHRTRKDISKFAKKVKNEAKEKAEDVAESIEELVTAIGERISDAASKGRDLEEDVKNNIIRALENSQKMIEKQKAKLIKIVR